jgi:hypothetical protein
MRVLTPDEMTGDGGRPQRLEWGELTLLASACGCSKSQLSNHFARRRGLSSQVAAALVRVAAKLGLRLSLRDIARYQITTNPLYREMLP